jgi:NitT/TauT family transport system substrate-binding protein
MKRLLAFVTLVVGALSIAACAPAAQPAASSGSAAGGAAAQVRPIKIALLPIVDSLPLHVAVAEGYYRDAGVEVELVTVASAQERTAAQSSGAVDGSLEDLIGPNLLNKGDLKVQVVHTLYQATPERAFYSLVTGKDSGIVNLADVKGKRIAIAGSTIAEYITDRLMVENGMSPNDIVKVEVPRIPQRAELVSLGQVDLAALVEPLATSVVDSGGRRIMDDRKSLIGVSAIIMAERTIQQNPEGVRRYVQATMRAMQAINAEPEKYRNLLIERANLPESLKQTFRVPSFPANQVPSEAILKDVQAWMLEKKLIDRAQSYAEIVNRSFIGR